MEQAGTTIKVINLVPLDGGLLARAVAAADRTIERIQDAQEALIEGSTLRVEAALSIANEDAQNAYLGLLAAGATAPAGSPTLAEIPLDKLDTPAMRRLVDALQFAMQCAQDVDLERGWVTPSGKGCGVSNDVGDLYERYRQQAVGLRGQE